MPRNRRRPKRRVAPAAPTGPIVVSPEHRVPITLLADTPRPDAIGKLTAEQQEHWRRLRSELLAQEMQTGFDPRHWLPFQDDAQREMWAARRAEWRAAVLQGDPRVVQVEWDQRAT